MAQRQPIATDAFKRCPELECKLALAASGTCLATFSLGMERGVEFIVSPGAFHVDMQAQPGFWLTPREDQPQDEKHPVYDWQLQRYI